MLAALIVIADKAQTRIGHANHAVYTKEQRIEGLRLYVWSVHWNDECERLPSASGLVYT